ncbi:MAG TPA: ABC transporter permease subunit [Bacteroidia bacterium]|nr:ABC transporter permease subunit [Bacteroidia bacterium]
MGFTLTYLTLLVLIPLSAIFLRASGLGWEDFWKAVTARQAIASYKVTFGMSSLAALTNAVFGFIVAWVLTRYRFPGRKLLDALVDLPFALPTAVAGISLTALYSRNGWLGQFFYAPAEGVERSAFVEWIGQFLWPLGIETAYSLTGIYIALTFIGLPFVVRTLQPVLEDFDREVEEAGASLGAGRLRVFFTLILPALVPSVLTGFSLAFARAIGEYGSVIFIAGNKPMKTEITPLLIVKALEDYNYPRATAVATVMLVASFVLLLIVNILQRWSESIGQARN